jgi:hypothetical protein
MFEDEKDDALTQLFKRSEANLDKDLPSADLWSRIENRLDQAAPAQPLKITKAPTAQSRYWMAAAALACVLSVGAVWKFFELSPSQKALAELQKASAPLAEDRNKEHSLELPVNEIEKEAKYKSEDSAQAAQLSPSSDDKTTATISKPKMLKLTNTAANLPNVTISQPTINAHSTSSGTTNMIVNPAPLPIVEAKKPIAETHKELEAPSKTATDNNAGLAFEEVPIVNSSNIIYSAPPISTADQKQISAVEKRQQKEAISDIAFEDEIANKDNGARAPSIKSRNNAKSERAKTAAPSANDGGSFDKINPRLVMFSWLLGQWSESRADGISREEWQLKNRNTIIGKGYKIKDKDKLFEENMTIYFDENLQQTYLSLNVDDFKKSVVYALSRVEGDQLVFLRESQGAYPEKVIIQRTKEGYTVIFANEAAELTMTQQSFLNHRNAVSNYKAVRYLRKDTKK